MPGSVLSMKVIKVSKIILVSAPIDFYSQVNKSYMNQTIPQ